MVNVLGKRSLARLATVHPDLQRVVKGAIKISEVDFSVICGERTPEEQVQLYAQGRTTQELIADGVHDVTGLPDMPKVTWTLNSRHFKNPATGYAHAVDLAPFVAGHISWDEKYFPIIAKAMKIAAKEADVPIEWGYDLWKRDKPHFQLPHNYRD